MRFDPRGSLSVQLIQEANFGPERFAPLGPPLTREDAGPLPFRAADAVLLSPPVETKPEACPADTPICDGRLGPATADLLTPCIAEPEPVTRTEVREVAVPTTLPVHVVGSLLDVLA